MDTTTTIRNHLSEPLTVGEPDVAGPLAVFPVFGPELSEQYVSLKQGRELGVRIGEEDRGASVRDIVVQNRTDTPVLLYEGEEVLGAQQNRTLDVTVLVAAKTELRVPVSCVEAGRWDGSRHGEEFVPAPQHAYPELRKMKNRQAREQVMAGMEARAEQSAVWENVARKGRRHRVSSPTGAMHDIYESHRGRLAELSSAVRLYDGQCGALVAIGGRFAVLDYVGRSEVFADLFRPLVQGYALDAIEAENGEVVPSLGDADGFLSSVVGTQATRAKSIGLGEDMRFAADGVTGAGVATEHGLVQLTAFPDDRSEPGSGPSDASRHIRRPSRRRRRARGGEGLRDTTIDGEVG